MRNGYRWTAFYEATLTGFCSTVRYTSSGGASIALAAALVADAAMEQWLKRQPVDDGDEGRANNSGVRVHTCGWEEPGK